MQRLLCSGVAELSLFDCEIEFLPQEISPALVKLNLGSNDLSRDPEGVKRVLNSGCRMVSMCRCSLADLPPADPSKCKVEDLDLSSNSLSELGPVFRIQSLRNLNIEKNRSVLLRFNPI